MTRYALLPRALSRFPLSGKYLKFSDVQMPLPYPFLKSLRRNSISAQLPNDRCAQPDCESKFILVVAHHFTIKG